MTENIPPTDIHEDFLCVSRSLIQKESSRGFLIIPKAYMTDITVELYATDSGTSQLFRPQKISARGQKLKVNPASPIYFPPETKVFRDPTIEFPTDNNMENYVGLSQYYYSTMKLTMVHNDPIIVSITNPLVNDTYVITKMMIREYKLKDE